jgi:hypothetical protein
MTLYALCAGQDCADREKCHRYKARHGTKDKHATWASFDIERKEQGGDCPAIILTDNRRKK